MYVVTKKKTNKTSFVSKKKKEIIEVENKLKEKKYLKHMANQVFRVCNRKIKERGIHS